MHKSDYKWQKHSNIINVNFVKDVIMDFSVYKNPYNNCCQMSFSPLRIHQSRLGSLQLSPSLPSQLEGVVCPGGADMEGRGGKN